MRSFYFILKRMKTRLYLSAAVLVLAGLLFYSFVDFFSADSSSGGSGNQYVDINIAQLEESDTDILGFYMNRNWEEDYETMMDADARVVNLDSESTFFILWVPEGYSEMEDRRVMVVMHGSGLSAYDEAEAELEKAQEHGYAIVGIQWIVESSRYLKAKKVYEIINIALRYMEFEYGSELDKVALEGYSVGSAISYEVTLWDRYNDTNYFALTISNQGGLTHNINSVFLRKLQVGEYGADPFEHARFFMYCGMEDANFGMDICYSMEETQRIIEAYGATVERFVQDPKGEHNGYHDRDGYHEEAIQTFIALTSGEEEAPVMGNESDTVSTTGGF